MTLDVNSVQILAMSPVYTTNEEGARVITSLRVEMSYKISTDVNGVAASHSHTIAVDLWGELNEGEQNQMEQVLDGLLDHLETELGIT